MQLSFFFLLILLMLCPASITSGDDGDCLTRFDSLEQIRLNPESSGARSQQGSIAFAWLPDGDCVVFTDEMGLWVTTLADTSQRRLMVDADDIALANLDVSASDGTIAFTVGRENTVYLLRSDNTLTTFTTSGLEVNVLAFSPDGNSLAVASNDVVEILADNARVQVWRLEDLQEIAELPIDAGIVSDLSFATDSKHLLVSGYWDIELEVSHWDVAHSHLEWDTSFLSNELSPPKLPMAIQYAAIQGSYVILGGFEREEYYNELFEIVIQVWNPQTEALVWENQISTEEDVGNGLSLTDLISPPDRDWFGIGFSDGRIQFRQTATGDVLAETQSHERTVSSMQFNPENTLIAIVGSDEQATSIRILDIDNFDDLHFISRIEIS